MAGSYWYLYCGSDPSGCSWEPLKRVLQVSSTRGNKSLWLSHAGTAEFMTNKDAPTE